MEAQDFSAWIARMKFNDSDAARTLELSRNTVARYKDQGAPVHIGLACAALASNLPEWQPTAPQPSLTDLAGQLRDLADRLETLATSTAPEGIQVEHLTSANDV